MKTNKKSLNLQVLLILFIVSLLVSLLTGSAIAGVTISPDFQGMLVITDQNGEVTILEAGDAVPPVSSGATLEVFDGNFTATADNNDVVLLTCLQHDVSVGAGAQVALSCQEESGLVEVLKGNVKLTDNLGNEHDLVEGTKYPIELLTEETAPPTGAAEEGGLRSGGDLADAPVVDSRSLQASPS